MARWKDVKEGSPLAEKTLGEDFQKSRSAVDFSTWWGDESVERLGADDQAGADDLSVKKIVRDFQLAVIGKSRLLPTQISALILLDNGKTQAEIAKKLKVSQPAISKAIAAAREKISNSRNQLGGPDGSLKDQALNWWRSMQE